MRLLVVLVSLTGFATAAENQQPPITGAQAIAKALSLHVGLSNPINRNVTCSSAASRCEPLIESRHIFCSHYCVENNLGVCGACLFGTCRCGATVTPYNATSIYPTVTATLGDATTQPPDINSTQSSQDTPTTAPPAKEKGVMCEHLYLKRVSTCDVKLKNDSNKLPNETSSSIVTVTGEQVQISENYTSPSYDPSSAQSFNRTTNSVPHSPPRRFGDDAEVNNNATDSLPVLPTITYFSPWNTWVAVKPSSEVRLNCHAVGVPLPDIAWYRKTTLGNEQLPFNLTLPNTTLNLGGSNDPMAPATSVYDVLSLHDLQPGADGDYHCIAKNTVGEERQTWTVVTRYPILGVEIRVANFANPESRLVDGNFCDWIGTPQCETRLIMTARDRTNSQNVTQTVLNKHYGNNVQDVTPNLMSMMVMFGNVLVGDTLSVRVVAEDVDAWSPNDLIDTFECALKVPEDRVLPKCQSEWVYVDCEPQASNQNGEQAKRPRFHTLQVKYRFWNGKSEDPSEPRQCVTISDAKSFHSF